MRTYQKNALIFCILLFFILLFSLIYILKADHLTSPVNALYADIYQDGALTQTINLNAVTEAYSFTVHGDMEQTNIIEVRPGSIGIISASCPDKICVHQGFISTSLLPITCLPNHLVIQIRYSAMDTDDDTTDASGEYLTPDILTY